MENQEHEEVDDDDLSKPRLNVRTRPQKRQLTITISISHDFAICSFASSEGLINQFGQPNRSLAIQRLIELVAPERITYGKKQPKDPSRTGD